MLVGACCCHLLPRGEPRHRGASRSSAAKLAAACRSRPSLPGVTHATLLSSTWMKSCPLSPGGAGADGAAGLRSRPPAAPARVSPLCPPAAPSLQNQIPSPNPKLLCQAVLEAQSVSSVRRYRVTSGLFNAGAEHPAHSSAGAAPASRGLPGGTASARGSGMRAGSPRQAAGAFPASLTAQTVVPATGAAVVPSEQNITLIEVDLQTASSPPAPVPPFA